MPEPSPALPPEEHDAQLRSEPGPAPPAEAAARDGVVPERAGWASSGAATGAFLILAGIALLGFPFLLDFTADGAAANLFACGGITVFLGVLRLVGVRHPATGYAAMAVGMWLFASSFFVGDLAREVWSERALGAVVFFLGLLGSARLTPDPGSGAASSDLR